MVPGHRNGGRAQSRLSKSSSSSVGIESTIEYLQENRLSIDGESTEKRLANHAILPKQGGRQRLISSVSDEKVGQWTVTEGIPIRSGYHLATGFGVGSWDRFGTGIASMRFISVHIGSLTVRLQPE